MGAVITFPEARRPMQGRRMQMPPMQMPRGDATVIILPVVRVARETEAPLDPGTETSTPTGRKRRRRASRT